MTAAQHTITDTNAMAEQGWVSLPSSYRMPDRAPTLAEAQQYCRELTESHYESFAVDLDLFNRGGIEISRAIEARNYDVLSARPTISKPRKGVLLLHGLAGRFVLGMRLAGTMA